ncbi:MAG TPA: hypothetical protein VFJ82_22910 [Longimicrobium sp.]|nr:hypothetical protein [Longimicrobium sp.]
MRVDAPEPLAMILPIPVPSGSRENAVRFINLEAYPQFFADLRRGFPGPPLSRSARAWAAAGAAALEVVEVGSFIASFVPSVADFERVDKRFRLPAGVWDRLPGYADFGFAVFQLKPGDQKVHPMAFEFPRANPDQLFFPTVHIHDGEVHPFADFDHALFCQAAFHGASGWRRSRGTVGEFVPNPARARGVLDPTAPCYRLTLRGDLRNVDVVVAA